MLHADKESLALVASGMSEIFSIKKFTHDTSIHTHLDTQLKKEWVPKSVKTAYQKFTHRPEQKTAFFQTILELFQDVMQQ